MTPFRITWFSPKSRVNDDEWRNPQAVLCSLELLKSVRNMKQPRDQSLCLAPNANLTLETPRAGGNRENIGISLPFGLLTKTNCK